ncbi:MAG: M24 family metallopeptidase [Gemmatimonadaceae bacterium]
MALLTPASLLDVQRAITEAGLDGWLLYDFRDNNPIARAMVGLDQHTSRRIFVFVPASGLPVAVTHNIEQQAWHAWPPEWGNQRYSAWRDLEALLHRLVNGKKVAMEYSSGDAVPYIDRVPAGVLEMVRATGATVVTSSELVSKFYASWNADDVAKHVDAAETIAAIAREAFTYGGERARSEHPISEYELQQWILERFNRAGLETYAPPNVSVGANAADPHFAPSEANSQLLTVGNVVLIDLWARHHNRPYADQTWMAVIGAPTERAQLIWRAISAARDAAIALLRKRLAANETIRGADVDDVSRMEIERAGYGPHFFHRTGHSIDTREIHGSGPNIDNLESRDERLLVDGVGFSIEPGIYLTGEIGMRTEVNAVVWNGELIVTPKEIQRELIVV